MAPQQLVLLVSGEVGWDKEMSDLALSFSEMNAMVVGINSKTYFKNLQNTKGKCYYPASDFEELSKSIQKKYHFKKYINPVLVGYSSGAALVYGILAQAPSHTFKGAMAFDFCPKIELSHPLCKGLDLKTHVLKQGKSFYLEPSAHMQEPFFVLNSNKNKTCDYATIAEFLKGVDNSEIIQVPAKGQGVASEKNWHPAMKEEFNKIVASAHNITNKIREEEKRVDYDQQ